MKKMTKNLPLIRRILARIIHKLQKKAVKKSSTLSLYYFLARCHFRLHYKCSIRSQLNFLKLEDKLVSKRIIEEYAIRRHLRIVVSSGLLTNQQIKVFTEPLSNAFLEGVNGIR